MKTIKSSNFNPILIIAGCVITVILFIILLMNSSTNNNNNEYRYDLIPVNDSNIIIFDKQTGEYWRKYVPSNSGPTNWEKEDSPIK